MALGVLGAAVTPLLGVSLPPAYSSISNLDYRHHCLCDPVLQLSVACLPASSPRRTLLQPSRQLLQLSYPHQAASLPIPLRTWTWWPLLLLLSSSSRCRLS